MSINKLLLLIPFPLAVLLFLFHTERDCVWSVIKTLKPVWIIPLHLQIRNSFRGYGFNDYIVTYSGFSIHDGTLLHSRSRYTTVKHSRKLFEHTYTSDLYGLGTLTPIEFFQQDLLWQPSNTHCHSCTHKAFKHTSGQSIVGLSVHLHTTTALRLIVHH
jgi:hypothetical protein